MMRALIAVVALTLLAAQATQPPLKSVMDCVGTRTLWLDREALVGGRLEVTAYPELGLIDLTADFLPYALEGVYLQGKKLTVRDRHGGTGYYDASTDTFQFKTLGMEYKLSCRLPR